jgi:hypothetical protein
VKGVVRDVVGKLKYHRLKPGGVRVKVVVRGLAMKLKYHRLKPGGVPSRQTRVRRTFQVCVRVRRLLPKFILEVD